MLRIRPLFLSFAALFLLASGQVAVAKNCGLYEYKARIVNVVDGDTVDADIDLGFNTWRINERLRLSGINAPEPRGAQKVEGLQSKNELIKRILDREVTICTIKDRTGKYGRYLATIYLGEININEWLVENGFAVHQSY